jgi:hypothetical protein
MPSSGSCSEVAQCYLSGGGTVTKTGCTFFRWTVRERSGSAPRSLDHRRERMLSLSHRRWLSAAVDDGSIPCALFRGRVSPVADTLSTPPQLLHHCYKEGAQILQPICYF